MRKRLVVCFDGTWSRADDPGAIPTNVQRLASAVRGSGQDGTLQIVLYLRGVGSTGRWFNRLLDGARGIGVDDNIRSAYMFLTQNYRSARLEDGPRRRGRRNLPLWLFARCLLRTQSCWPDHQHRAFEARISRRPACGVELFPDDGRTILTRLRPAPWQRASSRSSYRVSRRLGHRGHVRRAADIVRSRSRREPRVSRHVSVASGAARLSGAGDRRAPGGVRSDPLDR